MKKNLLKLIIFNLSLFFIINLTFFTFFISPSSIIRKNKKKVPNKRKFRNIRKKLSKYKKNIRNIKGKKNLKKINTIVSKIVPIIEDNKINLNINKDDYDFKKIYNEKYLSLLESEILNISKELLKIRNSLNNDNYIKEIFNKLDIIDKIADLEFNNNLINEKNIISSSFMVNPILNKDLRKEEDQLQVKEALELSEKVIDLLKIEIEKNENKYKDFLFNLIYYIYLKKEYLDLKKIESKNNIYIKVYSNFDIKYAEKLKNINKKNDFEKLYKNIIEKVLNFYMNIKNNINNKSFEIFNQKIEQLADNFQSKITEEIQQKINEGKKNAEDAQKEVMEKYKKDIEILTEVVSESQKISNENKEEVERVAPSVIKNQNIEYLKINYSLIEKNNKHLYDFIQNIGVEKNIGFLQKFKNIFVSDKIKKSFDNIVKGLYYLSDIENKNNLIYFFLDDLSIENNTEENEYYNKLKINISNRASSKNNFNLKDFDLIKLYSIINFEIEDTIKNDKKNKNNNEYKTIYDIDNENKIELEEMFNYVLVKIKDKEKELINIDLDLLNIEEVKNKILKFNYKDLLKEAANLFNKLVELNNKKINNVDVTSDFILKEKIEIIKNLILIKLSLIAKKNILYLKNKDLLEDLTSEEKNKIKLGDDYYVNFKFIINNLNLRIFQELNLLNIFYIIFDNYLNLCFEIINKNDIDKKEEFNKFLKDSFSIKNISIGSEDQNEKNILEKEYKQKINFKNTIINKFFGFNIDKSLVIDINNFKKMIKVILSLNLEKNYYSYSSENINIKIDRLKKSLKNYKEEEDKKINKSDLDLYKKDLVKEIFNITNDFKIDKYDDKYKNQNIYLSNRLLNFYFERVKHKSDFKTNEKLIRNEFEKIYKEEAILLNDLVNKNNLFDSVFKDVVEKIKEFTELLENDDKLKDKENFNKFLNNFIEICLFAKVIKKYYIDNKSSMDKDLRNKIQNISNEIINPYFEILYDNLFDSIRKLFVLNNLIEDENKEYIQDYKINDIYKNIEKNKNELNKINEEIKTDDKKNNYLSEINVAF